MKKESLGNIWLEILLLAGITLLAAALRFFKLGDWSYWVDELYTLESSLREFSQILNRPFWMITKLSLEGLGVSAFSLRFFPAIFGIMSIPILYFPLKAIFDRRVAFLAVVLLAISPWHIYLSQLARWYSLLLLVNTGSLISFYFFIERQSIKYLILSVTLFVFAFTLHLTAGFVLMISLLYLFLLATMPGLQPKNFNRKKVIIFLSSLAALALLLMPRFFSFVEKWQATQQQFGYWGSTPLAFTLKSVYHMTPTIGFVAAAGVLLMLANKERRGLFLAIYCVFPILILNIAAAFQTNVSTKYIFFTLPGMLVACSYFCVYISDRLNAKGKFIGLAMLGILALPSLQTDYLYFTSSHGNRNRLTEAVSFIKEKSETQDLYFPLYFFENPEEAHFYFKTVADLSGLEVGGQQLIWPKLPEEINLYDRIWVLTIGKHIPPNATGFYKWITEHANLVAEFKANRGPEDNTVKVYLHSRKLFPEHQSASY